MNTAQFLALLPDAKHSGTGWKAKCPAHDDRSPSLSIAEGTDGRTLLHCHAGCTPEAVCAALNIKSADLFADGTKPTRRRIVARYAYRDETGKVLFECVRYDPKDFRQRRPDPNKPGEWIWNLNGVPRVLYRLPELKAAITAGRTVFVAEGEKDAEVMARHGFVATCNPLGAKRDGSSWLPEHCEALRGAKRVVVIADKDKMGRNHARVVASALHGVAQTVRLIELPDRDNKPVKDAADFFAAGGTGDELKAVVEGAPEFVPAAQTQPTGGDSTTRENRGGDDESGSGRQDDEPKPVRKSAATRLVRLADEFAFFHDQQSRPYVRLDVNGHVEVWPVNSTQFRNLLARTFYNRTGTAINRKALADATTTLAGRACYGSPEESVFLRVAPHGENILIDLGDPQWQVVEVAPNGWRVLEDKSPVAFIRTAAMRPLPAASSGGTLEPLWNLLNVTSAQRPLVAGALLNYFHPHGPYFVTNFVGEQGTAKSCAAKILRLLVDPNETPLRSPHRTEQDLLVQAASNWCVALDNLSGLPPWLSDGLCRLSTGGGHSARSLYTDAEEFTLSVKRPVILNGIEDVAARPDLAERALQIELETIPDHRRISERELWRTFEAARPVILAAILDGVARALRELPNLNLNSRPRMADALEWATAGEAAFGWKQGTFATEYSKNLNDGAIASVEAHPVGVAVRQLLDRTPDWSGEPAQLLKTLSESVTDEQKHARHWPQNPRALSACLRRLAQVLRRSGVEVGFGRDKGRRTIRLCKVEDFASTASFASDKSPVGDAEDANNAKMQPLHYRAVIEEAEQEVMRL